MYYISLFKFLICYTIIILLTPTLISLQDISTRCPMLIIQIDIHWKITKSEDSSVLIAREVMLIRMV